VCDSAVYVCARAGRCEHQPHTPPHTRTQDDLRLRPAMRTAMRTRAPVRVNALAYSAAGQVPEPLTVAQLVGAGALLCMVVMWIDASSSCVCARLVTVLVVIDMRRVLADAHVRCHTAHQSSCIRAGDLCGRLSHVTLCAAPTRHCAIGGICSQSAFRLHDSSASRVVCGSTPVSVMRLT
jgi:hypothetical protein